jgi:uncharacterized protein (TIGR01244 family)
LNSKWLVAITIFVAPACAPSGEAEPKKQIVLQATYEPPHSLTIHRAKADADLIAQAATLESKTVVCNLTDAELEKNAAAGFDERAQSAAAGLRFVHIPIDAEKIDVADVEAFDALVKETNGAFIAHCASGNRSAGLYAAWLARKCEVPLETAIERAKALGLTKDQTINNVRAVVAQP